MASELSSRSKFIMHNSMCCLLKALEGKFITVDIRNDMVIQGKLESVESTMSLNMSNVVLTTVKGLKTRLAKFYIQGRHIRYVHIPDEVDIIQAMTWELSKKKLQQENERAHSKKLFENKQQRARKQRAKEMSQEMAQP